MAITNEEKRLALELYERYSDVLDSIYDALQSESVIDYTTSDTPKGRTTGKIAVKIDGQIFSAEILRDLLREVLVYIVDKKYVTELPVPWGTSKTRFIISNQNPPIHPNGRNFFNPVEYKSYFLETHYSRERGLKVLDDLCQKLELDFEAVEV